MFTVVSDSFDQRICLRFTRAEKKQAEASSLCWGPVIIDYRLVRAG